MNDKERSKKLLEVLRRHNAEVNEIVEDWRKMEEVVCKNQEVRIEPFNRGENIVIKFDKDYRGNHTHVEIWTEGIRRGYFHITEKRADWFRCSSEFDIEI